MILYLHTCLGLFVIEGNILNYLKSVSLDNREGDSESNEYRNMNFLYIRSSLLSGSYFYSFIIN